MTFEQVTADCSEACAARAVAKLIEGAALLLQRACKDANEFDRWRITAIMETNRCTPDGARKLMELSADIMERVRRG